MRRRIHALAVVCAAVVGIACTAPASSSPPAQPPSQDVRVAPSAFSAVAPTVVFLVRHAEKASDGTGDPPLTAAGTERATCLARMLGEAKVTHAYSTNLQRTASTVAPLAAKAGVEVTQLPANDTTALVRALDGLPPGSVAIVAGHSNTIPVIAAELGTPLAGLDDEGYFPHEEYDRLVTIVRAPNVTPMLVQLRYCAPSPAASH